MAAEVHVNDLGSKYQVPIYDDDLSLVNFDPSSATVKELRFRMPGVSDLVTRTATAEQVEIDGASVWCLTYTTAAGGSPDDATEFHVAAGKITIQGYIEYSDGRKWTSNKITTDHQGRVLKVYPNL